MNLLALVHASRLCDHHGDFYFWAACGLPLPLSVVLLIAGSVARAMKNMALSDLVLVRPALLPPCRIERVGRRGRRRSRQRHAWWGPSPKRLPIAE